MAYDPMPPARAFVECWAPDYCNPDEFRYKLCKLRLRGRTSGEYVCPAGEYCEELDCDHKCWLPTSCWCENEGPLEGRMMCTKGTCFSHASTQWGLCTPIPEGWEERDDEDELLPTGLHFYTKDPLLYNAKLHIDEDSPMKGALPSKDEL